MTRALFACITLLVAACARRPEPAGMGRRVAEGEVMALRPSSDGAFLAFLDGCAPAARGALPLGAALCDLRVVPAGGGEALRVARGVSSLPGGFAWSAEGSALAALDGFEPAQASGALVVWAPGGPPQRLAEGVTFWAFAPRGQLLGFTWRGALHLWRPGSEAEAVASAVGIGTFEFNPRGEEGRPLLLARRAQGAGGDLIAVTPGRPPQRVGGPAGDYGFSPGGERMAFTERSGPGHRLRLAPASDPARAGPSLGEGVTSFAFSRDGTALAFLAGVTPGRQGDLWVALGNARPRRLAASVGEFRWARDAPWIAWLEEYDPRVRSGALVAGAPGTPGAAGTLLGRNVSAFEVAPGGVAVAFLSHVVAGGYSVDLHLAPLAPGGAAEVVGHGVFGFDFTPDGKELWYRTSCVRSAEACDLEAIPASGLPPGGRPRRIADGVKSFEFDRRRAGRALLGWSREDRVALDLGVWEDGKTARVDRSAVPGTAFFLAPDSRRVAYAVTEPKRSGVYVAELPR